MEPVSNWSILNTSNLVPSFVLDVIKIVQAGVLLKTKDIPDCNAEGHPYVVVNGSLPLYNTR